MPKSRRRRRLLQEQSELGRPRVSKYQAKLARRTLEPIEPPKIRAPALLEGFDEHSWHPGRVRSFIPAALTGRIVVDGIDYEFERQVVLASQVEARLDFKARVFVRLRQRDGLIDVKHIKMVS